jgi:hypothetical protein
MKIVNGQRLLVAYSGILTAVFAVTVLSGFSAQNGGGIRNFTELNVQRINVVEPDGTLRMIISNKARVPGIFMRGVEYLAGQRNTAGIIFLNDEGTENGGLTYRGSQEQGGPPTSSGHLSFDDFMQDQVLVLDTQQEGDQRSSRFSVIDRPDWNIQEFLDLLVEIEPLPPAEQEARILEFLSTHDSAFQRIFLGRSGDRSVALRLKDTQGRDRAVLAVAPDGAPRLQFLDENGAVVSQFP